PHHPLSQLPPTQRAAGRPILDLPQPNPTPARLAVPADPLVSALADPRAVLYEPAPAGLERARRAIADYYCAKVGTERILLTTSTSEAYSYLFKLLTDASDEILVPRPSYPLF